MTYSQNISQISVWQTVFTFSSLLCVLSCFLVTSLEVINDFGYIVYHKSWRDTHFLLNCEDVVATQIGVCTQK